MPNRILREGILTSERVNTLDLEQEVFYRRLMSVVDDFGRFSANPALLRAALYPLKLDAVREATIERLISSCEKARLVVSYEVSGKRYLQMLDFNQQKRADKSKCPDPPSECLALATQPPSTCQADDKPPRTKAEAYPKAEAKAARKAREVPIPDGFAISERVMAWAVEKGHSRLAERFEQFVGYAKRKGATYADWDEAFMSAVREDWAKLNGKPGVSTPATKISAPTCCLCQRTSTLKHEGASYCDAHDPRPVRTPAVASLGAHLTTRAA